MVRDLIDQSLDGNLFAQHQKIASETYRTESLRHLWNKPLAWFGWNYVAATYTDKPRSQWELMFAPVRLRDALDNSRVQWPDGKERPLVAYTCTREAKHGFPPSSTSSKMLSYSLVGFLLSSLFVVSSLTPSKGIQKLCGLVLIFMGLVSGGLGTFHAALYWSNLEGLHPNLNQLLLSPVHFLMLPAGWLYIQNRVPRSLALLFIPFAMSMLALILRISHLSIQQNGAILLLFCIFYSSVFLSSWYRCQRERQQPK